MFFFFPFNILSSPLMGFFLQNISFFYDPKNIILWSSYEKKNDVDNGTRNVLREWITSTVRSPSQRSYHSMQKQLISLHFNIVISLHLNFEWVSFDKSDDDVSQAKTDPSQHFQSERCFCVSLVKNIFAFYFVTTFIFL